MLALSKKERRCMHTHKKEERKKEGREKRDRGGRETKFAIFHPFASS